MGELAQERKSDMVSGKSSGFLKRNLAESAELRDFLAEIWWKTFSREGREDRKIYLGHLEQEGTEVTKRALARRFGASNKGVSPKSTWSAFTQSFGAPWKA
jgi:hypothetical protein